MNKGFSENFIWGTATASYQIEGGAFEDGKGLSVWDVFCRELGRISDGSSGEIACDHYHRFEEDFALMETLGIRNYRLSVSWPRLIPGGVGGINQKGIDFYNRLIDSMLNHNITPFMTLFHWDYPYELFCKGGWLNRDSSDWFADYAELIAKSFGNKVKNFFTLNEPQCFIGLSYCGDAPHAPGIKFPTKDCLAMAHNVMLAHGKSVQALRAAVPGSMIGYAPTATFYHPTSSEPRDIEAARAATFDIKENDWFFSISWWNDPIFLGKYPDKAQELFSDIMPEIKTDDMKTIRQPIDFYGLNIYRSIPVHSTDGGYEITPFMPGYPRTGFLWPVTPECLYWSPKYLYERYKLPIIITENGISALDTVSLDGKVHDATRIDYIQKHLLSLRKAVCDGVDVRGYFHWSFLDNFEWQRGYDERFGIVYVDFNTLQRIPKDSALYYSNVIKTNGDNLQDAW